MSIVDPRRERDENGGGVTHVTREEHYALANTVLNNQGQIMRELASIRAEQGMMRSELKGLKHREVSLTDLAEAIEDERDDTQVRNLKKAVRAQEKSKHELRRALFLTVIGAASIVIAALVLRWLHV